jgi:PAS domain S-box-containing protein
VGLRKDGQEIPVEFSVSSWTTGGEVYYTGIVRDLTRRRQDEEEVLRLASIVESTDDSVMGITLEGIILIWNRGAEKLYGYQAGEVRGRPVSFLLSQGSREEITGILNKIKNGARVDHYETVHLRKDGQNLHVSVSISPLKNYQGKTTGISIIARDISERIKMQQELQKSHERLGNILESMSEAFMSFDHQWRFRYVNREAEKICQRPRESLIGRNLWEELPEWVETMLYVQYHRAMNEGTAVDFELAGVHGDKVYEVFACPSPDGLSVFFRDITERKKLEKEMARLDRLNLVGQMAAGIGHEIRNPMTSIRGFLQILSGKSECDHYREYFDLMIEELDRANAIVTEFLSMARNKTAEMHLCNINLIVEAISPLLTADAFNSKTDMVFELGEVPEIPLDEKEIRQLIMNLARNGMEAMTRGGRLTIKTFREGDEVVLAVQDQGAGIDNEVMESIGVPFFTTKENGTGLGLATCYGIAARHNANIQLETGPSGTIFSVRFSI